VECPKDEYGNYDFESLEALKVNLLNKHIKELLEGKEVCQQNFTFIHID
jgi:uridine kinase